jgi:hypothetical protein
MLLLATIWGAHIFSSATLRTILAPTTAPREAATQPTSQETEITKANWQQHPHIIAIREIVSATNADLKKGTFKISGRVLKNCDSGQIITVRKIAHDSKGAVPWYENYGEGQDASWDFQYYYDHAGRLRFVFAIARSANGTREQLRVYFDETGKRLWKTDKLMKGSGCPGCFSAYADSDKALAFDPAKDYADVAGCEEIKPYPNP